MKRSILVVIFLGALSMSYSGYCQNNGDFRSRQTGNWNDSNSWEEFQSGWSNSTNTPDNTSGVITIRATHTLTVTASVSIDETIIESSGTLTVNTGSTLTVNNGSGTDVSNSGTFSAGTGTISFLAGSTYDHARDGGNLPVSTWSSTSTCLISGVVGSVPGQQNQTFGNYIWNSSGQNSTMNIGFSGSSGVIAGDFTISNTGGQLLVGSESAGTVIDCQNDLIISGTARFALTRFTNSVTANVDGDYTNTSSSTSYLATSGTGILNVSGDFTRTGGFLQGTATSQLNFAGTSAQIVSTSGQFTNVNFTINSSAIVDIGTSTFSGSGNFTINSGGTLRLGSTHANGALQIDQQGGNILVSGTRTYASGCIFELNGASAQKPGNGFPSTRDLIISNASGVSLGKHTALAGLTIQSGSTLTCGSFQLSLANNLSNSGTLSVGSTIVNFTGTTTMSGTSTTSFNDINVSGTLTGSSGSMNIAGNFTNSGTFNHNNGTVVFNGTSSVLGTVAPTFANVSITGTLNGPNTLNVTGNFTNSGTFVRGTGTVVFNGSSAQTISGTVSFNNITISNSSGVNNNGNIDLYGTFSLSGGGVFDADGSGSGVFTLKSTSVSSNARIAELTTPSNFSGNISVERFINSPADWRYMSVPVVGANAGQWQAAFPVTGNFSNPSPKNTDGVQNVNTLPSINSYDAVNEAWLGVGDGNATSANALVNGVGYSVYTFTASDRTATVTGTAGKGTVNNSISSNGQGWNLIGNPYPSAIDWDNVTVPSGLWNQISMRISDGSFATKVRGGVVTNPPYVGWAGEVASGQSFWIRSFSASTFSLTESVKTSSSGQFFRETQISDYIRIRLLSSTNRDETILMFREDATEGGDLEYDAIKRDNRLFDLSILSYDETEEFTISTVPIVECSRSYKLNIKDTDIGDYKLEFTDLETFSLGYDIYLVDKLLDEESIITNGFIYNFQVSNDPLSFGKSRFEIRLDKPTIESNLVVNGSQICEDNYAIISIEGTKIGINYYAMLNGVAKSDTLQGNGADLQIVILDSLSIGTYYYNIIANNGCELMPLTNLGKVEVAEIFEIAAVEGNKSCYPERLLLYAEGAPENGIYRWYYLQDDEEPLAETNIGEFTTSLLSNSHTFYVAAVNELGCEGERIAIDATIVELSTPLVSIDTLEYGIYELTSSYVQGSHQWYMDNLMIEGATSRNLVITEPGIYSVMVEQNGCSISSDEYNYEDLITGITELVVLSPSVTPNPFTTSFELNIPEDFLNFNKTRINIYDINGKKVFEKNELKSNSVLINLGNIKSGIYVLNVFDGEKRVQYRIVKEL